MQYLLLIYGNEAGWNALPRAAQEEAHGAYAAFAEALKQAGALRFNARLHGSSDATTVRRTNGKTHVLDGPYADTKEQIGGYYLIDAPDLDAALGWAGRCPGSTHGVVEVRPLWA